MPENFDPMTIGIIIVVVLVFKQLIDLGTRHFFSKIVNTPKPVSEDDIMTVSQCELTRGKCSHVIKCDLEEMRRDIKTIKRALTHVVLKSTNIAEKERAGLASDLLE